MIFWSQMRHQAVKDVFKRITEGAREESFCALDITSATIITPQSQTSWGQLYESFISILLHLGPFCSNYLIVFKDKFGFPKTRLVSNQIKRTPRKHRT